MSEILTRVITVSDRCSRGEAEDASGPLAARLLGEAGFTVDRVDVVPDGADSVRDAIEGALDEGARLVLTTGGTGISPRDLTPEGTAPLLVARLDGLADAIRRQGEAHAPMAALSRGLVGVTGRDAAAALVVNAPGSTGGVRDTVTVIAPMAAHILDQLAGGDHRR